MVVLTIKIPEHILEELNKRIGRGKRSAFIKEAIIEKLGQVPDDKEKDLKNEINQLRTRVIKLESVIKKEEPINDTELDKENIKQLLNQSCNDETDRLIISNLLEFGGATTKELEAVTSLKRRQILTRIKNIAIRTEQKFGKKIIQFKGTKNKGKKQAWWIETNQVAELSNQNI
nr:ribbon-helix-helix domain-containing protein [Candidatus Freyarchaeota archaeon]